MFTGSQSKQTLPPVLPFEKTKYTPRHTLSKGFSFKDDRNMMEDIRSKDVIATRVRLERPAFIVGFYYTEGFSNSGISEPKYTEYILDSEHLQVQERFAANLEEVMVYKGVHPDKIKETMDDLEAFLREYYCKDE